jgi:hypothetical protein
VSIFRDENRIDTKKSLAANFYLQTAIKIETHCGKRDILSAILDAYVFCDDGDDCSATVVAALEKIIEDESHLDDYMSLIKREVAY